MIKQILSFVWQRMAMLNDKLFRHNCDFSGWKTNEELGIDENRGNKYQPTNDALIHVLKKMNISQADNIIDIGCGKGKAMYLMSKFHFGKISGIDLSTEMVDIANSNFKKLRLNNCNAIHADANDFCNYDEFNYFYIFNSVPEAVFINVMNNIESSISRNPRECVLIYLNPVYSDYIQSNTNFIQFLYKRGFMRCYDYKCYRYLP